MSADINVAAMVAPDRTAIALMGPSFVGWTVQLFIAGITVSVFWSYVRNGHLGRESMGVKMLVTGVFGLNCILAFCSGESIFTWGTGQDRTVATLMGFKPLDCIQPALSGAVGFGTQGWFARRSASLFENQACKSCFLLIVGLGMVTSFAGAIGISYFDFVSLSSTNTAKFWPLWKLTGALFLWSSAVVDSINTSVLCFLLATKVAHFNRRTDSVLKKLMMLSIETALYTTLAAIVAAAALAAFTTANNGFTASIAFAFWIPLPSLYTLGLLTTLISKDRHNEYMRKNPIIGELGYIATLDHTTRVVVPIQIIHHNDNAGLADTISPEEEDELTEMVWINGRRRSKGQGYPTNEDSF